MVEDTFVEPHINVGLLPDDVEVVQLSHKTFAQAIAIQTKNFSHGWDCGRSITVKSLIQIG